ncbi:MAG TPA: hypothetical protein VEA60_07595 [Allosphingosinicella sp.]|nr:hypothetical protein [Allosphingosinicella sp.]
MTARIDQGRKRLFLRALGESGNLTLSAERAGVSRDWARLHRKANPAFEADCRAALARAARRLGRQEDNGPVQHWRSQGDTALVVIGRAGRQPRIVRSGELTWTPRQERRFLAAVRETNNLRLACALSGLNEAAMLKHRKRWPGFERRLEAARAIGSQYCGRAPTPEPGDEIYERVEALLESGSAPTIRERINLARRAKAEETMKRRRQEREGRRER